MGSDTAELTLLITARDLGSKVVDNFKGSIGGVVRVAETASAKVGAAFRSLSSGITNGLGNLTENLASGAGLGDAMLQFGAYMAGQAAEGLIEVLLERMAGSSLIAAIGAPLSAAGSALGGVIAAAIPIGMAALPALLVAALVAAVIFLINNPEILNKIAEFAGGIVSGIVNGLATLAGLIVDAMVAAPGILADVVGGFVGDVVAWYLSIPGKLLDLGASIVTTIINGMVSFPGKVADVVREAFAKLKVDVGPFHITGAGVTIDLPDIRTPAEKQLEQDIYNASHHAGGGWAGLHGPELSWLGEEGPEYVRKAGTGTGDGGGMGVTIVGISEQEIVDMVDRGLFFKLRLAAPTVGRV